MGDTVAQTKSGHYPLMQREHFRGVGMTVRQQIGTGERISVPEQRHEVAGRSGEFDTAVTDHAVAMVFALHSDELLNQHRAARATQAISGSGACDASPAGW